MTAADLSRASEESDAARDVLLALRLRPLLKTEELISAIGASTEELGRAVSALGNEGLVEIRDQGRIVLTLAGSEAAAAIVSAERASIAPALDRIYPEFRVLNPEVKELCQRWQIRAGSGETDRLLVELGELHRRAMPMLDRLTILRTRYAVYRERLEQAVTRAGRGELDYVTGLGVDSFHSIWWQLHTDLLVILGRTRGEADL